MNVCFATVLDDKYLKGYLITMNSLLEATPDFSYDVMIFEWGDLSENSKEIIKKLYKNVIFKKVDVKLYEKHEFDDFYRKWTYNCNYRFDVFALKEYDTVVFFDCDIIFQNNINDLLKYDSNFAACSLDKERVLQTDSEKCFDAGLMVIGKRFLNYNTRDMLIKEANKTPPKIPNFKAEKWLSDEPILNNFFKNDVFLLPKKYNTVVSDVTDEIFLEKPNFQYTGDKKPWDGNTIDEQFSKFTIECITRDQKKYLHNIRFKKLLYLVKKQIESLLKKDIKI
jgi:lipopolysaccharide biosynthesis glycosyltransferase